MSLATFIQQERLLPLLEQWKVVVVYDADRRYRGLCNQLQSDRLLVVDASEGSIESREASLRGLQELGKSPTDRSIDSVLIYVPTAPPTQDHVRQHDPFASFAAAGTYFPARDGDEYRNLCLAAKPDSALEIARLFEADEPPTMSTVDALGSGTSSPTLTSLFETEGSKGLILSLLNAKPDQQDLLKEHPGWYAESQKLIQSSIGLALPESPIKWDELADELWQYILFSEFVFDLPPSHALPTALANVKRAEPSAKAFVYSICDALRDSLAGRAEYIRRARTVEQLLDLESLCANISDLGARDTFPFEEKTFFTKAVDALARDNIDLLRSLVAGHAGSIWVDDSESQVKWNLLKSALALVETVTDRMVTFDQSRTTMEGLVDHYIREGREIDFRHREFEQARSRVLNHTGAADPLEGIVDHTQKRYRETVQKIHAQFVRHLESNGWPAGGIPGTNTFFDEHVGPKLQETGRKTAVFMIDALRYELGHELLKSISEKHKSAVLQAYSAPLPSVTPVGMASLLPNAMANVSVKNLQGKAVVHYGDEVVNNVAQRMTVFQNQFGERFHEVKLSVLARADVPLSPSVDLLVVRSNDIDEQFESSGDPGLAMEVIQRSLADVFACLARLRTQGFKDVYIVTDHGFVLHQDPEVGDSCQKPSGTWVDLHSRILLGSGSSDAFNCILPASRVGIQGDFEEVAIPKALVPYRSGYSYFHGGASLQELVVPMLHLKLEQDQPAAAEPVQVTLKYRNDSRQITTRRPFVTLSADSEELFHDNQPILVRIQAHSLDNEVVGECLAGNHVDALGIISLNRGETLKVGIKMDEEFQGPFVLKALNPETLVAYGQIELETEYME